MTCVGPVTRAGCEAICVTYGAVCWGCRGLVDDPNINAHAETLKRYGLDAEGITRKFDLYALCERKNCTGTMSMHKDHDINVHEVTRVEGARQYRHRHKNGVIKGTQTRDNRITRGFSRPCSSDADTTRPST